MKGEKMKRLIAIGLLVVTFGFFEGSGLFAKSKVEKLNLKPVEKSSVNVEYISPKKALLSPGSVQYITSGHKTLRIEYEKLHKTGKFPIVKIQDIPFKLTQRGNKLEFTWHTAGYEITWMKKSDKVSLKSSNQFNKKTFSVKNKNVKNNLIRNGLVVETKRRDGVVSKLEIVNVEIGKDGKMKKFSVRSYANKEKVDEFQNENNVMAPEFYKQYEKGVNDEVLYIFTSDENGQIFVYYR